MSRIQSTFKTLKAEKRTALITYIMAGDPNSAQSLEIMQALPDAGADIIELGMPFSDPAADGETIQLAAQRAMGAGMTLRQTLAMVRTFRMDNQDTPIVLMGYANPLYAYGLAQFVDDAVDAGVDGLLIVDLPPEEDDVLRRYVDETDLDIIRLVTPTSDSDRLKIILDGASGFLYYVSITGVTGTASADLTALRPHIDMIQSQTDLPVAIGFGIKTPEDVAAMAALGDGVVVGSAIVNMIKDAPHAGIAPTLDLVRTLSAPLKK